MTLKPKLVPLRKAFGAETEQLADRQVRVVISTGQIDRSGDVVVQSGIDVNNFKSSRTVLWNHDQDHPVAACTEIEIKSGRLTALVQFPPEGVSAKADEVYGLVKAGVINAASIGFLPLDAEPVDGKNPRKGLRIDKSELLEFSFVSVPANPGAQVIERAFKTAPVAPAMTLKGLYACGTLAQLLASLGCIAASAASERAREGDESTVPDQLKDSLSQLGAILVAMTSEEVAELLASGEDGSDYYDSYYMAAPEGTIKALIKSGRKVSKATADAAKTHLDAIGSAHAAMTKMFAEGEPETTADDTEEKRLAASVTKAADDAAREKRGRTMRILALSDA